jgi:hypothetical protein
MNEKVGHIKATIAKTLSPIIDKCINATNSTIYMDGTISSYGNEYSLPVTVDFWSKTLTGLSDFERINDVFQSQRQSWNPNRTFAEAFSKKSNNRNHQESAVQVVHKKINWQTAQTNLDEMFDQLVQDQLLNLPRIEMPTAIITPLLDYQIDGIRWMYHHETMADQHSCQDHEATVSFPFYKPIQEQGKTMWLCEITNATQAIPPNPIKGSIL